MIVQQFIGLGSVALVFGVLGFAISFGEGYPAFNRASLTLAVLGIAFLTMAFGLAALADYLDGRSNGRGDFS